MHHGFLSVCLVVVVALAPGLVSARWDWRGTNITRAALRRDPKDSTKLHAYLLPERPSTSPVDEMGDNVTFNPYTGSVPVTDSAADEDFGPLVAYCTIKRHFNAKGWDWVELTADRGTLAASPSLAYFGVGYLEGKYTWDTISDAWKNFGAPLKASFVGTPSQQWTIDWITAHMAYLQNKTRFDPDSDAGGTKPFAAQVGKIMRWLDGLVAGYAAALKEMRAAGVPEAVAATDLTLFDFVVMNLQDEIGDVQQAMPNTTLNPGACPPPLRRQGSAAEKAEIAAQYGSMHARWNEHCSSLLKLTKDDVIFTHTTWGYYRFMGRQYKTYHLETSLVLSGYPANFASFDDWVMTSNGLIVSETTNNQFSNALSNAYVLPNSVSEWIRVAAANLLSTEVEQWANIYINGDGTTWEGVNSGTYCNQNLVLNLRKISEDDIKRQKLKPGTFLILEQLPGPYSAKADMSDRVSNTSFWPSFNRNYFQETAEKSCVSYYAQTYGPIWGYKGYARYELFQRLHGNVSDIDSMKDFIRYNNWRNDAESRVPWVNVTIQAPVLTIAARYDLLPVNETEVYGNGSAPIYGYMAHILNGAIDAKIASWRSVMSGNASGGAPFVAASFIINGPTQSHGQPAFRWSTAVGTDSHEGLPDLYNYSWVTTFDALSPPPAPIRSRSGSMPAWQIALIVAMCVVGVIVLVVAVRWARRRSGGAADADGGDRQPLVVNKV